MRRHVPAGLRHLVLIAVFGLVLAACGGGASSDDTTTLSSTEATEPGDDATTTTEAGPGEPDIETMPLDDLYELALDEGGELTVYGGGSVIPDVIPVFEERFPGMSVENVDSTADEMVARAIAEFQGGRVIGDVFQAPIQDALNLRLEDLVQEFSVAESESFDDSAKGDWWVGTEFQYLIIAWNTDMVAEEDAPRTWEELADPKWNGMLMADPRDAQLLATLAEDKYEGDEARAVELFEAIAENDVFFSRGRREMGTALLPAGERAVCFTCNSHHFPEPIAEGAPLGFELDEGIAQAVGTTLLKDSPHPLAGMLFLRWITSEEGQQVWVDLGRIPASPDVEPLAEVRPDTAYVLPPEVFAEVIGHYTDVWREIFDIRE